VLIGHQVLGWGSPEEGLHRRPPRRYSVSGRDGHRRPSNRFVMDVLVRDHRDVFRGLTSLVDVGGGSGGSARAIAAALPHVRCSILELPHVVASVPQGERGGVEFVAGDMFENVPKADAVLLKVRRPLRFATSSSLSSPLPCETEQRRRGC